MIVQQLLIKVLVVYDDSVWWQCMMIYECECECDYQLHTGNVK